jgi:hypothetical protein
MADHDEKDAKKAEQELRKQEQGDKKSAVDGAEKARKQEQGDKLS